MHVCKLRQEQFARKALSNAGFVTSRLCFLYIQTADVSRNLREIRVTKKATPKDGPVVSLYC